MRPARHFRTSLAAAAAALAIGGGAHAAAPPADDVQVTTDYPGVAAEAGDTVTFDIDVTAARRDEVALTVTEQPDDWSLTLRGGGFVIDEVTADPDDPPSVELEVAIPPGTPPGDYTVALTAESASGDDRLDLTIEVADRPVGGIVLATEFPTLRGKPSDTFRYDLEVTNQTPDEATFAFDGRGPDGWTVTAGPASEQRASTVTVGAGETESVRVEATPTGTTPAGSYSIVVTATGGGQSGSFELVAEVTGQPELDLVSANGRLDVSGSAGDELTTSVIVGNDGSAPLEDVRLTADEPIDWTVSFDPEEIDAVPAGESREVTVVIEPTGNAVAGDYAVGVSATAGAQSADLAYRFTVETSRWWGAVGVAIIAAALLIMFGVFRRFGRR